MSSSTPTQTKAMRRDAKYVRRLLKSEYCTACHDWHCYAHSLFVCTACRRTLRVDPEWSADADYSEGVSMCDGCYKRLLGLREQE